MLTKLRALKKHNSYAALTRLTGAPELTLIRWIHGRHKISRAWMALLETRLKT